MKHISLADFILFYFLVHWFELWLWMYDGRIFIEDLVFSLIFTVKVEGM